MKAAVIYRRTFCQLVSLKLTGENGHYSSHLAVSQIASSLGHSHGDSSSNIQQSQMRTKKTQTNKKASNNDPLKSCLSVCLSVCHSCVLTRRSSPTELAPRCVLRTASRLAIYIGNTWCAEVTPPPFGCRHSRSHGNCRGRDVTGFRCGHILPVGGEG